MDRARGVMGTRKAQLPGGNVRDKFLVETAKSRFDSCRALVLSVVFLVTIISGIAEAETYTVKYGDSLWKIASRKLGSGKKWRQIWMANRKIIRRPNHIRPGMKLTIPRGHQKPQMDAGDVPAGYRYWKTVKARVMAYEPSARCCGSQADGKTSTGGNAWILTGCAVAPKAIPYGTGMKIKGVGWKVADDTGGTIRRVWRRRRIIQIEIRMKYFHQARAWGKKWMDVKLYKKDLT